MESKTKKIILAEGIVGGVIILILKYL